MAGLGTGGCSPARDVCECEDIQITALGTLPVMSPVHWRSRVGGLDTLETPPLDDSVEAIDLGIAESGEALGWK